MLTILEDSQWGSFIGAGEVKWSLFCQPPQKAFAPNVVKHVTFPVERGQKCMNGRRWYHSDTTLTSSSWLRWLTGKLKLISWDNSFKIQPPPVGSDHCFHVGSTFICRLRLISSSEKQLCCLKLSSFMGYIQDDVEYFHKCKMYKVCMFMCFLSGHIPCW